MNSACSNNGQFRLFISLSTLIFYLTGHAPYSFAVSMHNLSSIHPRSHSRIKRVVDLDSFANTAAKFVRKSLRFSPDYIQP